VEKKPEKALICWVKYAPGRKTWQVKTLYFQLFERCKGKRLKK